jgi:SAM-dependent methyltransferase
MAQYQSFPDVAGDSRTLEKLKALKFPDLAGRSFLDVGCNEGFFCGFARFAGAGRSVGIDHSSLFVERARQRFPDCEFHRRDWSELPSGPFDVVLLASALHYAEDQAALVHRLADLLSPGGLLILELGIVSSQESEWVEVERGIDRRSFPTMAKLREVLDGLAWKWMGPSVRQDGDPVARHVVHVSRRRPLAYLLMQPPAYGKTTISEGLFPSAGVTIVSGDRLISDVAEGRLEAPRRLADTISRRYSPFGIDEVVQRIFESGLGADLVRLWVAQAGGRDFALDAYVPPAQHAQVEDTLIELGYLPVRMDWKRAGPALLPAEKVEECADAFFRSMGMAGAPRPKPPMPTAKGFVDRIALEDGVVRIRGWVVSASAHPPSAVVVRFGGKRRDTDTFENQSRPDVQKHLGLGHADFGFSATVRAPEVAALEEFAGEFDVFTPEGLRIPLSRDVAAMVGGKP